MAKDYKDFYTKYNLIPLKAMGNKFEEAKEEISQLKTDFPEKQNELDLALANVYIESKNYIESLEILSNIVSNSDASPLVKSLAQGYIVNVQKLQSSDTVENLGESNDDNSGQE